MDFIKNRFKFYGVAIFTSAVAILALFVLPLNLWIDMTGWMQAEYVYTNNIDIKDITKIVEETKKDIKFGDKELINTVSAYKVAGESKFIVEAGLNKIDNLDTVKLEELKTTFKTNLWKNLVKFNSTISLEKYQNIWESFWAYIKQTAYVTLFLTIIFISLYIAWAFRGSIEWFSSFPFASVTIITLFHDVLAALWFYLIN